MNPAKLPAILLGSVFVLALSSCSQISESLSIPGSSVSEPSAPEPSVPVVSPGDPITDPCAVIASMEQQFSQSVAGFVADPSQDALVFLENEFNTQVELLYTLIESSNSDPNSQEQVNSELDNAISQKDEAVRQYTESTQTDNILQKGVLLAGAVVAAQDAVATAQGVVEGLGTQLACTESQVQP